jgi:hypothetical protein
MGNFAEPKLAQNHSIATDWKADWLIANCYLQQNLNN